MERHGSELENDTAALDWFNDVFGGLGNENKACLVRVEFQDTTERLLGHLRKIRLLGIVKQNPGDGAVLGLLATDELREALSDSRDAAVIR
jgi:hypothetical protein